MSGLVFGRLTVVRHVPDESECARWLCKCDCGQEKIISRLLLVDGRTKSCGCLSRELTSQRNATHGHCRSYQSSKAYHAWQNMRKRCLDTKNKSYENYGGRGITICPEWMTFHRFLADMGNPPSARHSIDRRDNSGNYCPENCRWATAGDQTRNRRNARILTHMGKTMNLCDWAIETGIKTNTIAARLDVYKWPIEDALTIGLRRRRYLKTS